MLHLKLSSTTLPALAPKRKKSGKQTIKKKKKKLLPSTPKITFVFMASLTFGCIGFAARKEQSTFVLIEANDSQHGGTQLGLCYL